MYWLDPEIVTPPVFEPVELAAAKASQGIDSDDFDTLLTTFLASARGVVEDRTGLKLATQTVKLRAWAFDCREFVLPLAPIQSISSITYVDGAGAVQTLSTDIYATALYGLSPTVALKHGQTWPNHLPGLGHIVITCIAGYLATEAPAPIKGAVMLAFGDHHAFRETVVLGQVSEPAGLAIDSLLINHRRSAA